MGRSDDERLLRAAMENRFLERFERLERLPTIQRELAQLEIDAKNRASAALNAERHAAERAEENRQFVAAYERDPHVRVRVAATSKESLVWIDHATGVAVARVPGTSAMILGSVVAKMFPLDHIEPRSTWRARGIECADLTVSEISAEEVARNPRLRRLILGGR